MLGKIKVSKELSRDKILPNKNGKFKDIISLGESVDLRNNSYTVDLQNGYEEIVPIDESKIFEHK